MTTTTVANRPRLELQDGTRTIDALVIDPWQPPIRQVDQLDRVVLWRGCLGDAPVIHQSMSRITIDGVMYRKQDDYGIRFFTLKDDDVHASEDGYCDCTPVKYAPVSYSQGEICEPCWMAHGIAVGIGKFECPHK